MKCFLCAGAVGGSGEILLGKLFCGACTRRFRTPQARPSRSLLPLLLLIAGMAICFAFGYLVMRFGVGA